MGHLKRLAMPASWPLKVKGNIFAPKPRPGPHSVSRGMPLILIVRDILHFAENAREARKIIFSGKLLVDGKVIREPNYTAGLFDSVSIPSAGMHFRLMPSSYGLKLAEIREEDGKSKPCRVESKKTLKGGRIQIGLHDGRAMLADNKISRLDTVVIEVPKQKMIGHHKLEAGKNAIVIAGSNAGAEGTVKAVKSRKYMLEQSTVTLDADGKEVKTVKEYVMALPPGMSHPTALERKPRRSKP
ncbi:MAG: 30S ribosomal protein S4e [Candidatus Aenigmarchaeota archaeon]|nr:30S ribosomal protein S4e [Candidatus Aenigmarchaeota archaeon]